MGATRPVAVFLMGPTATGKTELAVALARRIPCGIVSVDSALVYRGMDIGTAKPGARVLAEAPHHLIDVVDPSEAYSAGRFRRDALAAMAQIADSNRMPLLVGGTMLYFRALARGLAPMPRASARVREAIDARAAAQGWPALHAELAAIDTEASARIHPNDAQRIQRALEVFELTGQPISQWQQQATEPPLPYDVVRFALTVPDRAELERRIEKRFDSMISNGFVEEVRRLFQRGDLTPDTPAIRAVGYRQLWEHLAGHCSLPEARRKAVVATRRLAKRQMTWLRSEPGVTWLDVADGQSPDARAARLEAIIRKGRQTLC